MKKLIILLFAVSLALTASAQKVKLELNLKKGKVYTQKTVSKNSQDMSVDGNHLTSEQTLCTKYEYKVSDIQDTIYTLQVKYLVLSTSTKVVGIDSYTNFSSENKTAKDNFSKALSAMTNKPFYMKISKRGKVFEVNNFETIMNAISDELVEVSDEEKEKIKKQILPFYGKDAATKAFQEYYNFIPNEPVYKGEKWTKKSSIDLFTPYTSTSTFELKEINKNSCSMVAETNFSLASVDATVNNNRLKMTGNLQGKRVENIKIDKKSGWIIERITTQTGQGIYKATKASGADKSIDLCMSMSGETIITQE